MKNDTQNSEVERQYATTQHLAARGSFQAKYATVGWFGWLIDHMGLEADAELLDVGCGPGWLWRSQAEKLPKGLKISLIDTSPHMVEEAKANLATVEQIKVEVAKVADAVALPFATETFDAVVLLHVLYHVSDPKAALEEARRILRPGGRVFVSTNTRDSMNELHRLAAQAFGGEAVDPGAALFSLDDAVRLIGELFSETQRSDLVDVMTCTDAEDAVAYLLSMPPGNMASADERNHLASLIREESERGGGALRTTRRNGLVVGTKPL